MRLVGETFGKFLVSRNLDLGQLHGEFQTEKNREPGGQSPNELLVAQSNAAQGLRVLPRERVTEPIIDPQLQLIDALGSVNVVL